MSAASSRKSQPLIMGEMSPITKATFDPKIAGEALADALKYLQKRLGWSSAKIADTLHLPSNTLSEWIRQGRVPLTSRLSPDAQLIIHLLAIHRSLESMFENPEYQQAWLATYHSELNAIPEELMSQSSEGLICVRRYLEYV